jgi:hypothetical protein
MRMEKIRSAGSLRRAAMHNTRERPPLNADPLRREENWVQGGSVDEVMKTYQEKLPDKVRKNAVHAVELVMTASADFQGDWHDYLKDCTKWTERLFGKENVLSVAYHFDERTPHAQILVMPLKDGKLNAKHFIGGSRDRMAELQDDFYKEVGWPAGLMRGQSRAETKARHTHHNLTNLEQWQKVLSERDAMLSENISANKDLSLKLNAAAAELEEQKKKINAVSAEVMAISKMSPPEITEMKRRLATWDQQTPASLRQYAGTLEREGYSTVGDRRKAIEAQQEKKQQQKNSRGFSR